MIIGLARSTLFVKKKRDEIRGSTIVNIVIKQTIELQNGVLTLNATDNARRRIYLHLITDANQFESVRRTEITGALVLMLDYPHKALNTIKQVEASIPHHILNERSNTQNV